MKMCYLSEKYLVSWCWGRVCL